MYRQLSAHRVDYSHGATLGTMICHWLSISFENFHLSWALEEKMTTTPEFLLKKSLGQRVLASNGLLARKGLGMTEWLSMHIIYIIATAATAKSLQSCPTLCDPIDGSPPGSPDPGILQARTLEWVAISFSNAGKWKVKVKSLSRVRLLATPWTTAYQAPPSMGFSRQEYWSGLPLPSPLI